MLFRSLYSLPLPDVPWTKSLSDVGAPLKVGWSPTLGYAPVDKEVLAVCEGVIKLLEGLGTEIVEVPIVFEEDPIRSFLTIAGIGNMAQVAPYRDSEAYTRIDPLWFDPARRASGRRQSDPADWSPPLDAVFARAAAKPTGVKLGPALDHALLPSGVEAQWVSVDRDVVELVVWTGPLARDGVGRSALLLGGDRSAELTAPAEAPDAEPGAIGEYLLEPDGAVIRARLIGELARRVGGRMLDPTIAWITTDAAPATPFGQAFRVREELPFDERKLKSALRERDIGTLEIKKRGVDVDPASFRTRLGLKGASSATLVLTRIAGRRVAILADRIAG